MNVRIKITGRAKKLEREECRRAVALWGKYLLGPRLDDLINLTIKFDPKLNTGQLFAYVIDTDDRVPSRCFRISVCPTLSKKHTLRVIAHEMVHVRQNAKGILKSSVCSTVKWHGKSYEFDESSALGYWLTPWEIESRGYEEGLLVLLEEDRKKK